VFAKEYTVEATPSHILEPLQAAYKELEILGRSSQGGGLPQSCRWTSAGLPREQIGVKVVKSGRGIHLSYGFRGSEAKSINNNNNTFTWSGPSWVLAAPYNGPKGRHTGEPRTYGGDGCHAVPLNLLTLVW
jgi:hypothetical protein